MKKLFKAAAFVALSAPFASAQEFKPEEFDPAYDHDRWRTTVEGCDLFEFRAFLSCFDTADDDNGDGAPDKLGVPQWVAYEIKRYEDACVPTKDRPGWIWDEGMAQDGLMPRDESYRHKKSFLNFHSDWFERGHLMPKQLAARLGEEAEWNSHTFFNAVPQRSTFNADIWNDLEDLTGAWAQQSGSVWVIAGPVYAENYAVTWLGEDKEIPVAIPDALYKIVVRENSGANAPDVLAFIYPQIGPGYFKERAEKGYDHSRYATTVDEIERLTGIDFLTGLADTVEKRLEANGERVVWPTEDTDFIRSCPKPKTEDVKLLRVQAVLTP